MSLLSAVGAGLFAAGVGAGWFVCRDRGARARAHVLELELESARRDHVAYREQVEKHFSGTSRLFRELSGHYSALYAHLADGAHELCRIQPPALAGGPELENLTRSLAGSPRAEPARSREELKPPPGG